MENLENSKHFDYIFTAMYQGYKDVVTRMADIYSKEGNSDTLTSYMDMANRALDTLMAFTNSYCEDNRKNTLLVNLMHEKEALGSTVRKTNDVYNLPIL